MRYKVVGKEKDRYDYIILVNQISETDIFSEYIKPFHLENESFLVLSLYQDPSKKKTPVKLIKQYIDEELAVVFREQNPKAILCTDADYFKVFAKKTRVDPHLGYVLPCVHPEFSTSVIYVPSYKGIFYNPNVVRNKIAQGINTFKHFISGSYTEPGSSIIHFEEYPDTPEKIKDWLIRLQNEQTVLTCDIETFSLKHYDAGLASITFCWNKHEGIAFSIDNHQTKEKNQEVREILKEFFKTYTGKLIFHNIAFDVTVLIYQLWMKDLIDTEGLLTGLKVMMRSWDDTKLICYLATNSCARTELGLKAQSQEYSGNYAQDEIGDVTKIPLDQLLRYNLIDGLSTWYVYEKYHQKMIDDRQLTIYTTLFKPATIDIIQMQLTGMPLDMDQVEKTKADLIQDRTNALNVIQNNKTIQAFTYKLNEEWVIKRNNELKTKRVSMNDAHEVFNPNSTPQMQRLLYEELGLPILAYTESKAPAVDSSTIKDLINHTENQEVKDLLQAFVDYSAVEKILTAFIPAFEQAQPAKDGRYYLFGSLNLGGTVSGRLSSNSPNMQNLPATGSKYAKPIKKCFKAPEGWLFVGLDFSALEDHISALLTKDPNKLAVYLHGYDGHSLRAYSYWQEKMPDIEMAKDSEECYTAKVGGTDIWFHENEQIEYLGKTYTGKQLYELLTNQGL